MWLNDRVAKFIKCIYKEWKENYNKTIDVAQQKCNNNKYQISKKKKLKYIQMQICINIWNKP